MEEVLLKIVEEFVTIGVDKDVNVVVEAFVTKAVDGDVKVVAESSCVLKLNSVSECSAKVCFDGLT